MKNIKNIMIYFDIEKGDPVFTDSEVSIIKRIEKVIQDGKSFTEIIQDPEPYGKDVSSFIKKIMEEPKYRIYITQKIATRYVHPSEG